MTKGQKIIIKKLQSGERLIRRREGSTYYWANEFGYHIKDSKSINNPTIYAMVRDGLLEVGIPIGESRSRHLPTAFALAALEEPCPTK